MALGDGTFINFAMNLFKYRDLILQATGLITEFQAVEEPWDTATGLRDRAVVLVKGARIATALTPSPDDDAIVEEVAKFVTNDSLLVFVAGVLQRFRGSTNEAIIQALTDGPEAEKLAEELATQNLEWSKIFAAIKAIMELVAMFQKPTAAGDKVAPGGFDFLTATPD